MTASIYFMIPSNDPNNHSRYQMATETHNIELSRVPCVGEYVSLGEDTNDVRADYVVVLVKHVGNKHQGTDAEVYLNRVDLEKALESLVGQRGRFDIDDFTSPKPYNDEGHQD